MSAETVIQRWDDDAVLINLDPPIVARVRARRSVWPALVLAVFTGLTGAGLAISNDAPPSAAGRLDASERPPPIAVDAVGHKATRSSIPAETVAPSAGPSASVLATARVVHVTGHRSVIRIAGIAAPGVERVDVVVAPRGHPLGRAIARIDSAVSFPDSATGGSVAPWAVEVELPDAETDVRDGVVTVEIRWRGSSGQSGATAVLVVTLGDGRSAG
jgi:hypothetical protein